MPEIEPAPAMMAVGTDKGRKLMVLAAGLVGLAILAGSAYWIFAPDGSGPTPPALTAEPAASEPSKEPEPTKASEPVEAGTQAKGDMPAKAEDTTQAEDPPKDAGQPASPTK